MTTNFEITEKTLEAFDYEIDLAKKKLAKLNKRLAKLGAPLATMTVGETRRVEDSETGLGYNLTALTVSGVIAKHNGWTPLASLDWTVPSPTGEAWATRFPAARGKDGENGVEIPARFLTDKTCTACGTKRARNVTSLWVSDEGEFVTLGSNCVLDFIGVDPTTALWLAGNADPSDEDEFFGGDRPAPVEPTVEIFLAAADIITEEFGFIPTSEAGATRDLTETFIGGRWTRTETEMFSDLDMPTMADGAEIAAWVMANMTSGSDFEVSARKAIEAGLVHARTAGILAFLPTAKRRAEAKAVEAEAVKAAEVPSFHIGEIKARLRNLPVTITAEITVETHFGTSKRVNGVVASGEFAGAKVSTFGSGKDLFGLTVGGNVEWTGTVKAHKDDNFGVVTEMARVALIELDENGNPLPEFVRWCNDCSNAVDTASLDPAKTFCDACLTAAALRSAGLPGEYSVWRGGG